MFCYQFYRHLQGFRYGQLLHEDAHTTQKDFCCVFYNHEPNQIVVVLIKSMTRLLRHVVTTFHTTSVWGCHYFSAVSKCLSSKPVRKLGIEAKYFAKHIIVAVGDKFYELGSVSDLDLSFDAIRAPYDFLLIEILPFLWLLVFLRENNFELALS